MRPSPSEPDYPTRILELLDDLTRQVAELPAAGRLTRIVVNETLETLQWLVLEWATNEHRNQRRS